MIGYKLFSCIILLYFLHFKCILLIINSDIFNTAILLVIEYFFYCFNLF